VRRFSAAHEFKEQGVDDLIPAFRLKDITNYLAKVMTAHTVQKIK
jgi:hypothetical protein